MTRPGVHWEELGPLPGQERPCGGGHELSTQEDAGPPSPCVSARPGPRAWSISADSCVGSGESRITPWGSQQNVTEHSPESLGAACPTKVGEIHRGLKKTVQKPIARAGARIVSASFLAWARAPARRARLTPEASSTSPGVLLRL